MCEMSVTPMFITIAMVYQSVYFEFYHALMIVFKYDYHYHSL